MYWCVQKTVSLRRFDNETVRDGSFEYLFQSANRRYFSLLVNGSPSSKPND